MSRTREDILGLGSDKVSDEVVEPLEQSAQEQETALYEFNGTGLERTGGTRPVEPLPGRTVHLEMNTPAIPADVPGFLEVKIVSRLAEDINGEIDSAAEDVVRLIVQYITSSTMPLGRIEIKNKQLVALVAQELTKLVEAREAAEDFDRERSRVINLIYCLVKMN